MTAVRAVADEVAAFLPTLEMAREADASLVTRVWWRRGGIDLLQLEPKREERVAAIVARARRVGSDAELLRYAYVPNMPFALQEGTSQIFERAPDAAFPTCLRVELERRRGGDPYRGVARFEDAFHGHDYGAALEGFRTRVRGLRQEHGDQLVVESYAWPILRLRFEKLFFAREVALLVRPDRVMQALLCRT